MTALQCQRNLDPSVRKHTLHPSFKYAEFHKKLRNRKALRDSRDVDLTQLTGLSSKDIQILHHNFRRIAPDDVLTLELFKTNLSIVNIPRAEHLARQMFNAIDTDRDGFVDFRLIQVFFEDYVSFTNILTSDDIEAKANYSFRMLDYNDKGHIDEDDVYLMMSALFELFSILTGHKIYLMPEYTRRVYRELDNNNDGRIEFREYKQLYAKSRKVFPWFEWFNQDDLFAKEVFARHEMEDSPGGPNFRGEDIKGDLGKTVDEVHKHRASSPPGTLPPYRYSLTRSGGGGFMRDDPVTISRGYRSPKNPPFGTSETPEWRQKYQAGKSALKTFDTVQQEPEVVTSGTKASYGSNFVPQLRLVQSPPTKKSKWNFFKSKNFHLSQTTVRDTNRKMEQPNQAHLMEPGRDFHPMLANSPMCHALMDDEERRESFNSDEYESSDDDDSPNQPIIAYRSFDEPYAPYGAPYAAWTVPGMQPFYHGEGLERREAAMMSSNLRKQTNTKLNGRNVGLFFGHENWGMIMNLMIGFRGGLKM